MPSISFCPSFSPSLPFLCDPPRLFSPADSGLIWSVSLAGLQHLRSFHLTQTDEACRHFTTVYFHSRLCFLESSCVPDCCLCHSSSTRRVLTSLSPRRNALPTSRVVFEHAGNVCSCSPTAVTSYDQRPTQPIFQLQHFSFALWLAGSHGNHFNEHLVISAFIVKSQSIKMDDMRHARTHTFRVFCSDFCVQGEFCHAKLWPLYSWRHIATLKTSNNALNVWCDSHSMTVGVYIKHQWRPMNNGYSYGIKYMAS